MVLTETARRQHDRSRLRRASDCRDAEWAVVEPFWKRKKKPAGIIGGQINLALMGNALTRFKPLQSAAQGCAAYLEANTRLLKG